MKISSAILFLFIVFIENICGQNSHQLDSLWTAYKQAEHDTTRIRIINKKIGPAYKYYNPDSAIISYEMAIAMADRSLPKNISPSTTKPNSIKYTFFLYKATSLFNIGIVYYEKSDYDTAIEYYQKAYNLFEELQQKNRMAECYRMVGIVHNDQGSYDLAIENYLKALVIYEEAGNKQGIAYCYTDIGIIHYDQGNYDKTIEYFLKSLEIKEELKDQQGILTCYINIGVVENSRGRHDLAIEYFLKALKISEDLKNKPEISTCYTNIGVTYADQGNYDEAIVYYLKALKIDEELQDKRGMIILDNNISNLHIGLADSIPVHDSFRRNERIAHLDSAIYYGTRAYDLAKEIETASLVYMVSEKLQSAYKSSGNYKKALQFAEIVIETKDTIISKEKTKALAELQTKYETEKKEQQIELQETQLMAKDVKIKQQQILRNALMGGLAAIIIIIVLVVNAYLQKRKVNKKITYQNERILAANEKLEQLNEEIFSQKNEIESQRDELAATLENLERTQNHLIESKKMASLGGLVAGVAHEINTPVGIGITAISSLIHESNRMAELYRTNKISRKDFKEYLSSTNETALLIHKNLERTASLVQRFKQVSIDQSSELQREFYLKEYLEDVISSLHTELAEKNINIIINCDETLKLNGYPGAIAQIYTNLISNSIIHGFKDKELGNISITVRETDEQLEIEYKDNGKGIPEAILSKVFDPFVTSDPAKGTGLGLHILYNLVTQKLNGTINCVSTPGEGAVFTIQLPKI